MTAVADSAREVRGDLLARLGRDEEAAAEVRRAAELSANRAERELLRRRAEGCGASG